MRKILGTLPKGGVIMGKTEQKVSQEGWRTTKKERRCYIIGDLGRTLEGYIVTAMMSTFMISRGSIWLPLPEPC